MNAAGSEVDAYVAALGRALRGPRRVKADLVAEARDSLTDAADAYESAGSPRQVAERRAVDEFGPLARLAPDYQRVLAFAQARRTALVVFLVGAVQSIGSTFAWQSAGLAWPDPTPAYLLLATTVDWLGIAMNVAALALLVMCGAGTRFLGARRWLPRATGVYALAVCGTMLVLGVLLASGYHPDALLSAPYQVWLAGVGLLPLVLIGVSGYRCLNAT